MCEQEETYTAEDAGTHELPDREESGRPADVLQRLEAATEDRRRGLEGAERIAELLKDAGAKYGDDYAMNKALRRRLRCDWFVMLHLLHFHAAHPVIPHVPKLQLCRHIGSVSSVSALASVRSCCL